MRRTVLSSITVMSLTALSIVIGACATAPADDSYGDLVQEQKPTAPEEQPPSAKLPPKTQSTDEPADAGTDAPPKQAAAPKDAGAPPQDASPPPPPPTTGGDCDANDPMYYFKFLMNPNPGSCPCSASECCYLTLGCVAK